MKSLVNNINDAVKETLFGLSYAFPQLEYQASHKVVLMPKIDQRKNKVSVISGGGSGHEPFAAGYVGNGMLTASVAGSIYAAPPSQHISYAIERVSAHDKTGVLMIVPNYTGDCLNFGTAIERARGAGLKIAEIIVNEDCSIPKEEQGVAGKRGLTGIVFIIKIAGALAEKGLPLEDVRDITQEVLQNLATYAVGLTACAIPGQPLMFELADDKIELGLGIHGEAGCDQMKLKPSSEVVSYMLKQVCNALSLKSGDFVAVLVNNFGALSQLEQGVVVHDVVKHLRLLMTSLNSAGVHITLLKLPEKNRQLILSCLDAPTDATKWPGCAYSVPPENPTQIVQDSPIRVTKTTGVEISAELQAVFKRCLKAVSEKLLQQETYLNELDRGCGDGDTGSTLRRLANETLLNLDKLQISHPASVFIELSQISEEQMGGTSGALFCLFFTNISSELMSFREKDVWLHVWARALRNAVDNLMKYGKAKVGDRSMIDVLHPVCETLEKSLNKPLPEVCDALKATALQACESTKKMKAKVGRASYVKRAQHFENVDAGAYAVATCVEIITNIIKDTKF